MGDRCDAMRQQAESTCEPAEAMQRLRDLASKSFDIVFENSQVMMHVVDHHFRIAKVNQRWTERMGFQSSEVIGRRPSEFSIEESRAHVSSKVAPRPDQCGHFRQVPVYLISRDGRRLDSLADFQICRTGSCFALEAWYDRECPVQLEWASWTMGILVQLSRLQHEFELFWPTFDGHSYTPSPDRIWAAQLLPTPGPESEEDAQVPTSLLSVDLEYHRVTVDDKPVTLTPREWAMLRVLVKNAGRVIGPRQLLQEAWGPDYSNEVDYIQAYISRDSPDQTNFPGYSSFWDTVKYYPAFQGRQMRPDSLKFPVFI